MIKGIIFDVDGVLLDTMPMWENVADRYLQMKKIEPKPELMDALFTMSLEESADYIREAYSLSISKEDMIKEVVEMIHAFYRDEAELKPGVRECLASCKEKGLSMVVASSSDEEVIRAAFQRLEIEDYFLDVMTCTKAGASKKYPTIYFKAQDILGTKKEETLVIEDAYHGICTAKNAGYKVLAVYDSSNETDWENIKETADAYVLGLEKDIWIKIRMEGRESNENSVNNSRK